MASAAQGLRDSLADLLLAVGPDARTLCEGWTSADLAAHLVTRERRPDAALGIVVPPLSSYTDRVMRGEQAGGFEALVAKVRRPPAWSPFRIPQVDDAANTVEFAVHQEDVRRGEDATARGTLPDSVQDALWTSLTRMRRVLLRKAPGSVRLETPDGRGAGPQDADVTVCGEPLELVMFSYGRQQAATVDVQGSDSAVQQLRAARLGL